MSTRNFDPTVDAPICLDSRATKRQQLKIVVRQAVLCARVSTKIRTVDKDEATTMTNDLVFDAIDGDVGEFLFHDQMLNFRRRNSMMAWASCLVTLMETWVSEDQ